MPKHCSIYVFNATYELNQFSFFDISRNRPYFNLKSASFLKSPLYQALSDNGDIKVTCYFSGAYLEALAPAEKELNAIKKLVKNGQIELLMGTYHDSLSCLFSANFFHHEMANHKDKITTTFEVNPVGFLNTAAIFSNNLVDKLQKEEISYLIAPRIGWYLGDDSSARVVKTKNDQLNLLLVGDSKEVGDLIISYLPGYVSRHWDLDTITVSEAITAYTQDKKYSLPTPVGLNPENKDLAHFLGNSLQKQVFKQISVLSEKVYQSKDEKMMQELMVLSSPAIFDLISQEYSIRYDYYTSLMNCLTDLELRLSD